MNSNLAHPILRQASACVHLSWVSARRLFWSRQTVINLLLLGFAAMVVVAWSRRERSPEQWIEEIVLPVYVSFLLPIFCLCYATATIAGDRDEQTLVYLLVTPLHRMLVFLAKYVAALALVLTWSMGGLGVLSLLAGAAGRETFAQIWPSILLSSIAYTGLFHLISVIFQRATIVALGYALLLESVLGNMPGIIKRVAISFYTQCMLFESCASFGIGPAGSQNPELFLPISGEAARLVLLTAAIVFFVYGGYQFCRREYVSAG